VLSQLSPFIPLARSIHHSKTPLRSVLFGIHSSFGGLAQTFFHEEFQNVWKKENKEDKQKNKLWTWEIGSCIDFALQNIPLRGALSRNYGFLF
jgi:hypothetical protein